ncbi:MAG TPA: hypothetical protein VGA99_06730, partial [bacterium]
MKEIPALFVAFFVSNSIGFGVTFSQTVSATVDRAQGAGCKYYEIENDVNSEAHANAIPSIPVQAKAIAAPVIFVPTAVDISSLLDYRSLPLQAFKYDTSNDNPEHRCYEIVRPISKHYN